jgi:DnaJ-class molecular chaperone
MSIDHSPIERINDCKVCWGTGVQGWSNGDEYEVKTCDECEGKPK